MDRSTYIIVPFTQLKQKSTFAYPISYNPDCPCEKPPWNSTEFHGKFSMEFHGGLGHKFPWNSMEISP